VVLAGGVIVLLVVAVRWLRGRRAGGARAWTALGAGAVVLALMVAWGSSHGERHAFPMRNVYAVRVLPFPDRVEWFAAHGMPQSDRFLGPHARLPYREGGLPPVVYVPEDDAELQPWLDWVGSDGRLMFARFVATHPEYLVTEPLREPERTFNNAQGDRSFYAPPDMSVVPFVDRVLALPTTLVLVLAGLAITWVVGRRRWTPVLATGSLAAALAVPHGLLAWHSDGMETARHLMVPSVQLHLGVLLMAIGALAAPPALPPRRGWRGARPGYGRAMADETPLTIRHPESKPIGGVVVVQEAFGVTEHIEDVCQRLADVGWLAVAPHMFHRTGDPVLPYDDFSQVAPHAGALTPDTILDDVDAALGFLEDAGFPPDTVGIVGFCMGGTVALTVAVERQVGAAVSFYGGGVAKGRFGLPPLVESAPKLRAPWLGLFGDEDKGIPVEQVEQLREAAAEAGVATEIVRYEGAGHGFNRDGSPAYDEAAATDAWARTLDWFARNLTTGATEVSG
jgi:carboxymethylenebutenolidase